MLWMKLPGFDRIQPQSNQCFSMGVENKAIGDQELNNGPVLYSKEFLSER